MHCGYISIFRSLRARQHGQREGIQENIRGIQKSGERSDQAFYYCTLVIDIEIRKTSSRKAGLSQLGANSRCAMGSFPLCGGLPLHSNSFSSTSSAAKKYLDHAAVVHPQVDFMLGSYMEDIGITPEQFEAACGVASKKIKTQFHQALFEQVEIKRSLVAVSRSNSGVLHSGVGGRRLRDLQADDDPEEHRTAAAGP